MLNQGSDIIGSCDEPLKSLAFTPEQLQKTANRPYLYRKKDDHVKGSVYFLEANDLIKIGFSGSVAARIKQLRALSPVELTLLGTAYCHKRFERRLHAEFAHLRVHGEWFRKSPELLQTIRGLLP